MNILRTADASSLPPPQVTIEVVTDTAEAERVRQAFDAHELNSDWLQHQWSRLLPRALGKHVAVANREAFVADSTAEAWAWIKATHPTDKGRLSDTFHPIRDRESMLIPGKWVECTDGRTRPVLTVGVPTADGELRTSDFLVDTGADRTVLCRETLDALGLPSLPPAGNMLGGIGGQTDSVMLDIALTLRTDSNVPVRINGPFMAFLTAEASDMDLLGRDVLNNFDVIVSYRDRTVLLLAPNHRYQVVES